jgi:hypothetical protein
MRAAGTFLAGATDDYDGAEPTGIGIAEHCFGNRLRGSS